MMRKVCGRLAGLSIIVYLLSFSIASTSCSSIDCPIETTVCTRYAIMDAAGESTTLTDSLWVWTRRSDGVDTLLNCLVNAENFFLPVSYSHPEDTLVFFKGSIYSTNWTLDTLWLKKNDIPHFESVDCGTHFFHRLTAVRSTHNGIDSVVIVNPNVNYDASTTHLNIYFRVKP